MRKIRAKTMLRNALVLMMCVCVGTAFSFSFGTETVSAVSKPGKVKSLSAKAKSYQSVYLSWSKASRASGYQIVRNGKEVCKTKSRSYTNTKLKGSTTYSYKVRAYRTYTQKQYYNKKTKKWQKKRPAKKYRGATKRVKLYRYGSYSPARTVRTPEAPVSTPTPVPDPDTPKIPGEKDTDQTFAQAEPVVDDSPKEVTAKAPEVANADDPEKVKPTSAKAADPAASVSNVEGLSIKKTSKNLQLSWTAQGDATGYQIFRAESETDTPVLIYSSAASKYCDISGLSAGKTYYYQVRAFKTVSGATYYGKKTDKISATLPSSSEDGKHIFITDTGITLSWDEFSLTDEERMEIAEKAVAARAESYYSDYKGGWDITIQQDIYDVVKNSKLLTTFGTTDTSYVDKNVSEGQSYTYEIKKGIQFTAESTEEYGDEGIITITGSKGYKYVSSDVFKDVFYERGTDGFSNVDAASLVKLAPPLGFSAIGNYDNVSLSWDENKEAAGYKIYRDGSLISTIENRSTCTFKDEGLTPQTSYRYTIKSTNEKGGVSANASALTIKTPAKPSFLPPAGFSATATYCSVHLKWTPNSAVNAYKLYRNDTLIATMRADEKEYMDCAEAVTSETGYTYSICSVKGSDESVKSVLTIKTPKSPALLPPENVSGKGNYNNVAITWLVNESADSYNIYRNDVKIANVPGNNSGYVDAGLTPRTIYTYAVSSVIGDKESEKAAFKIATPAKPDILFEELSNVTLSYGNATIHLGQKWTDTLKSQLAAGSSGTDAVSRVNFLNKSIVDPKTYLVQAEYILTEDIYMFDTGDYDRFLAVYVANGQIVRWTTNMENMGSESGKALKQGDVSLPEHGHSTMTNKISDGAGWYNGIAKGGVFIGGFQVEALYTNNGWQRNIEGEKRIGLHYMNAYRSLLGSKPLEYSDGLDGHDYIFTGTYTTSTGKEYTNSRYGAQPFAETCSLSRKCTHGVQNCTKGPLAGQGSGARNGIIRLATGISPIGENVATGALGEGCISVYADSALHLSAIYNPDFTKVGIGFGDMSYAVHAELFAK